MPWIGVHTDQEAINKALAELSHESDRAAGIVAAVLVEEALTTLLQSRLNRDQDLLREIFRSSGPLGAFSVTINMGFLMGLYSEVARKELQTIKEIRNEFAHRIARSFSYDRIRDLANNLSLSEKVEFHLVPRANGETVIYIGTKPPGDEPSTPVLPPITSEKLVPRERYLRACQFHSGALLFSTHTLPAFNPPVYF
jgi:hypothetical protein